MKYLKFVLVVVLLIFSGSCELTPPLTTYYYTWSSGCPYHGQVVYGTPGGGMYTNQDIPLLYFATKNYRFEKNEDIGIVLSLLSPESFEYCTDKLLTVTIMKGTGAEGSVGSGGEVWKSNSGYQAVGVDGKAD
jgi:hypothetical protein